jgi:recombination protein RecR
MLPSSHAPMFAGWRSNLLLVWHLMSVIDDLTAELARLPGIGRKTALRLTYFLLKRPPEEMKRLARVLENVADRVRACSVCGNLTEDDPCVLCSNPRRDRGLVCVVEEASDIGAIERSAEYRGLYHVLGGRLSPLEGIGPDELNLKSLIARLGNGSAITEVIVATNPSVEGEATALYLQRLIQPMGIRVTRLARGLPVGGDLEYADGVTIAQALSGRRLLE